MKRRLYLSKIFAIILLLLFTSILCGASPIDKYQYKTILPDTPLYAESNEESTVLIKIPQNAKVTLLGENFIAGEKSWQKVLYTDLEGYLLTELLYPSIDNDNYTVRPMTVVSDSMGGEIPIYSSHTDINAPIKIVFDGEKVNLIEDGLDYGEYAKIEYEGEECFIFRKNITSGLSYNQRLAVIISSVFIGIAVVVAITIILLRKRIRRAEK